ncbi:UNVERIFIED_ORG: hypothetical protein J2W19_003108 [Shinella zoogloeoides]|nr:hypothetical protein [Shinella zoogloeoides]
MDNAVVKLRVKALVDKRPVVRRPDPTPEENVAYTETMLRELKDKAMECDWLLAHFIEMAWLHATDLRANPMKMQRHRK